MVHWIQQRKQFAGTLTITGADNGYAGTLTLGNSTTQGGTLALSGAGALNSASVIFGPGATSVTGTYAFNISTATDTDALDGSSTPWRSPTRATSGSMKVAHGITE